LSIGLFSCQVGPVGHGEISRQLDLMSMERFSCQLARPVDHGEGFMPSGLLSIGWFSCQLGPVEHGIILCQLRFFKHDFYVRLFPAIAGPGEVFMPAWKASGPVIFEEIYFDLV
jgi:hypothetical protein